MMVHVALCHKCKDVLEAESGELYDNYKEICMQYCTRECAVLIDCPQLYDEEILYRLEGKRIIDTHQDDHGIYVRPIGHFRKTSHYHVICGKLHK